MAEEKKVRFVQISFMQAMLIVEEGNEEQLYMYVGNTLVPASERSVFIKNLTKRDWYKKEEF